ncbi:uncharacterized protein FA14DRAFT_184858 [Meira miltonrushii]|uniref:Uncharacterized protein n=1 Tax=Meira miltonrushii TaxID=1280837 RepID=A0A316VIS7_9BASI|nr:uncharacterized protein FA14DRAFT_184858 [Meira miltonrushii]PWN36203.1 hypothetical protein FA14DRAFT_184858 [Meira miltonrushii]
MRLPLIIFALLIRPSFGASPPLATPQAPTHEPIDLELRLGLPSATSKREIPAIPREYTSTDSIATTRTGQKRKRKTENHTTFSSTKTTKQLTPQQLERQRERVRLQAQKNRQRIMDQGAEAIEEEKKKQKVYNHNYRTRLYQDPVRLLYHRKVRRAAAMRRYNAKISDNATAKDFRLENNEATRENYKKRKEHQQGHMTPK